MKILIYGGKGWIGTQFVNILTNKNVKFQLSSSKVILDTKNALINEIDQYNPTHIISFIGRTHGKIGDKYYSTIDYLEQPGKLVENLRDNFLGPKLLAEICERKNIHFTYIGTGCVFNYKDNDTNYKFREEDHPNFFGSSYSIVKGYTDTEMRSYKNTLNLRIRMPITDIDSPRNFITKITKYEKICSISNSMSVLPDLLPLIYELMITKRTGTLNFTNPGVISHNEILEMYKEHVDPNFTWENFTIEEQNKILSSARSNNHLDTTKLERLFPNLKNIKDSVRDLLKKYNRLLEDKKENVLLVTGGAGFIGSHFINNIFYKYKNIEIINIDSLYYCANINNVLSEIRMSERYEFININLRDFEDIKNVFIENKITHIIHFAAQSHVDNSFLESLKYTQDNILGTHNLLECARIYCTNLQKFIHISTDEVYGESMLDINEKHKTESSVLCPTNPYAATKASAELIASAYYHSFNLPIVITRGNNVYGPNQYPEKLIPKFINLLKNNNKVTIHGDGSCVRSFLHVSDTVDACLKILEYGKIGEIYNIGCDIGMEYSVLEITKILIKKIKNTDKYENYISYIEDRPYNDKRYYISNDKLKNLGWEIQIDLDEGLNRMIKL
jgi:dTDP-glucose 4,6-dehydratase